MLASSAAKAMTDPRLAKTDLVEQRWRNERISLRELRTTRPSCRTIHLQLKIDRVNMHIYRYHRPSTVFVHHTRRHLVTFQVTAPITATAQHHNPAKDLGTSLGGELPPCVSRVKSSAGKTHCLSAQVRFRSNSYHGASVSAILRAAQVGNAWGSWSALLGG